MSIAWYHTFAFPDGEVTPGYYDLRDVPARIDYPDVRGLRCLDVGSANGFWAFELERRGAAEVVSLDLEDPAAEDLPALPERGAPGEAGIAGTAFAVAREKLGSSVKRIDASIYDLDPATHGTFDVVFVGSLLLHLRDPIGALQRVHGVCRTNVISLEPVSLAWSLLGGPFPLATMSRLSVQQWWLPNRRAHRRMLEAAGFTVQRSGQVRQPFGKGAPQMPVRKIRNRKQARFRAFDLTYGVPSQWLVAKPSPRGPSGPS